MKIICQGSPTIVNMDNVQKVFLGKYTEITACFSDNLSTRLGIYKTREDAEIAFEILCDAIGKYEKFVMPDEKQIKAKEITKNTIASNANSHRGRKAKGYGGS